MDGALYRTAAATLPRHPSSEGWAVAVGVAGGAFTALRLGVRLTSVQLIGAGVRVRSKLEIEPGEVHRVALEYRDVMLAYGVARYLHEGQVVSFPPHEDHVALVTTLIELLGRDSIARFRHGIRDRYGAVFEHRPIDPDTDERARRDLDGLSDLDGWALIAGCETILADTAASIDRAWPAVSALAWALLRERYLSAWEASAIVGDEPPGEPLGQWQVRGVRARLATRVAFGIRDLVWALQGRSSCVLPGPGEYEWVRDLVRNHPRRAAAAG